MKAISVAAHAVAAQKIEKSANHIPAHVTASATLCPRIDLNDEAVQRGVANAVNENPPAALDAAQTKARHDRILVGFGGRVGLMLQEAGSDEQAFCNAGRARYVEGSFPQLPEAGGQQIAMSRAEQWADDVGRTVR